MAAGASAVISDEDKKDEDYILPSSPTVLYANRTEDVFTSNKYEEVYKYNYACQNGLVEIDKVLKVS